MHLEADRECLVCDYCHNIYFPDANDDGVRVLGEPATEACPVCAVPLVPAAMSGQRILYCARCRGMLILMDVFVALVQELRARRTTSATGAHPPDWNGLRRHILCPRCHQTMNTHPYGGPGNIIIDNCPACYLNWLDAHELNRIVSAPDHQYNNEGWTAP
jgi:Zn-finger nucleic acid-binding protein